MSKIPGEGPNSQLFSSKILVSLYNAINTFTVFTICNLASVHAKSIPKHGQCHDVVFNTRGPSCRLLDFGPIGGLVVIRHNLIGH